MSDNGHRAAKRRNELTGARRSHHLDASKHIIATRGERANELRVMPTATDELRLDDAQRRQSC